jgi:DNA-binding SARP family transcriptional activator
MSHLSLVLLGTPIVQLDQRVVTFRTRKALALLVYLAVEGGLHSRDKLVALFWPDSGPGQGRATLRSTLAYLRRALDESSPSADDGGNAPYLIVESDILGFNFEADFRADWLTLQSAWTLARGPARLTSAGELEGQALSSLITQLQTAANLYQGDFLTGFSLEDAPDFDDWTGVQREACHRRMGLIFDRLSQLQAEGGELINAVETASRWVVLDPLTSATDQ